MKRNSTLRNFFLLLILALSGVVAQAQNAYLQNAAIPRFTKAGISYTIKVRVRNATATPITSFMVRWKLDGGAWNNGVTTNVSGGGITTNNFVTHTHPTVLNVAAGPHTVLLEVITTTDTDASNNTLSVAFTALSAWAPKVVLLEGRTETWCQYCPPANTETNDLASNPAYAISKWHVTDGLSDACPNCSDYFENNYDPGFTPATMIEMGEYGGYTLNSGVSGWEADLESRAAGVSPVELTMTSALNWNTRVLTVQLTAEFTYAVAGPHKLNVYVLEDLVPGPQTNAPANYIHNKVMRAMLGGATGTTGVLPTNPVVGTAYTQTYTYTVPATFKLADLKLIGVAEHAQSPTSRFCLNAVKSGASMVGVEEVVAHQEGLSAWPNPFADDLRIWAPDLAGQVNVELFNLEGQAVIQHALILTADGFGSLDLQVADLPPGAYLLRVSDGAKQMTQRVVRMN